jgi:phosphonate transport system ATP-binding protein
MLRVEHLTKVYPNGTRALTDVSFEVNDGEFLAVIGLSGSGKSTLLRCINRLIEPTSGKIFWNDEDLTAASAGEMRRIRRQIGMVFQQFNLVKRSSVLTNVLTGRLGYVHTFTSALHLFSAADNQKAVASLEQVGLEDKAHVRADSLSGGQQQRVGIARALMQDPKLILADEPVASLDPVLAHSILKYLEQLNKENGIAAICSLHFRTSADGHARRLRRRTGVPAAKEIDDASSKRSMARRAHLIVQPLALPGGSISSNPSATILMATAQAGPLNTSCLTHYVLAVPARAVPLSGGRGLLVFLTAAFCYLIYGHSFTRILRKCPRRLRPAAWLPLALFWAWNVQMHARPACAGPQPAARLPSCDPV